MKAILLDSQSLLWAISDETNFGTKAARRLLSSQRVHFSSISVAEFEIKRAKKKLAFADSIWDSLESHGYEQQPFDFTAAKAIARFGSLDGHDPFDRMLIAQAASRNMDFFTADEKLISLGFDWVIDARV